MTVYLVKVRRCSDTGLYVGYVPALVGAHSQAETLDELREHMREVIKLILEDDDPNWKRESLCPSSASSQ